MTHYITISDSSILYMDDETGNILLSIESLPPRIYPGEHVTIHFHEDNGEDTYISQEYIINEVDNNENVVTLDWVKQTEHDTLVESPVIKLSPEDTLNSDKFNLGDVVSRAEEEEKQNIVAAAAKSEEDALRLKYANILTELPKLKYKGPSDAIQTLFDALVPSAGAADTVAGELVRATMRLLYRDYNDGDKFYEGYGLKTCASSASYLSDNGFNKIINNILDSAAVLTDSDYTRKLNLLADAVVNKIVSEESLLFTPNKEDSREYNYDYIEESAPRYDYSIYASDEVDILIDEGIVNAWDLYDYISDMLEYESVFNGAEVERPFSSTSREIEITNLTYEGYDYIKDYFERDVDRFWKDFVDEHPLETEDDE